MVEAHLEGGEQFENRGADGVERLGKPALEAFERGRSGGRAARRDQVADGARLREIEAPVAVGAASEFAGRGGAGARLERGFHDLAQNFRRAVRDEFEEVLAGRRGWAAPVCRNHAIDDRAVAPQRARRRAARLELGIEQPARELPAPGAGNPHDPERGTPGRGRERYDGLFSPDQRPLGRITSLRHGPSPSEPVVTSG